MPTVIKPHRMAAHVVANVGFFIFFASLEKWGVAGSRENPAAA
jgi:hypothetical protein